MKKSLKSGGVAFFIIIIMGGCAQRNYSTLSTVTATVTFQSFYDDLQPYGAWIDYPGYGQVWHPRMEVDFRPYVTNGYWIYSNEGWAWVSGYDWGWAPFHYGRWMYDDLYGWLWIPGYEWAPAWVTWGYVDDYYAWAPLLPDINVLIQFNFWKPNIFYWNVCPKKNIYDKDLPVKITRPDRINDFENQISIINNFNTTRTNKQYYSKGPDPFEVERFTNKKIDEVTLKTVRKVNPVTENSDIRKVFRPPLAKDSRPKEYKRVENDRINPIQKKEQMPVIQQTEQKRNIEKLPVYKNNIAPYNTPVKTVPEKIKKPSKKNGNG